MATTEKVSKIMKTIGTHSGVFHCDEALACFMLKQLPEYKDAEIIRTRDENVSTCPRFKLFKLILMHIIISFNTTLRNN